MNTAGTMRDAIESDECFSVRRLDLRYRFAPDGNGLELAAEAKRRQDWKRMVASLVANAKTRKKSASPPASMPTSASRSDLHELRTLFANPRVCIVTGIVRQNGEVIGHSPEC